VAPLEVGSSFRMGANASSAAEALPRKNGIAEIPLLEKSRSISM